MLSEMTHITMFAVMLLVSLDQVENLNMLWLNGSNEACMECSLSPLQQTVGPFQAVFIGQSSNFNVL